ncbi:MAG: cytochrome c biogenesis protein CcsA [Actinomycetia bacterium]|nr:cytochrome c biogenesis protein CcsA [Actinomycetes bacterium]
MTPNVGSITLWAAFGLALAGTTIAHRSIRVSRGLVRLAAAATTLSALVLSISALGEDYYLAYIADNVRSDDEWPFRLASIWAGAEGSLLVFSAIVAVTISASAPSRSGPLMAVGATITVLTATSALASNPFARLDITPLDGAGSTPILDHPAMLVHPPLLYLGMALALVPALAPAGSRVGVVSARASFTLLTAALALGAAWAYVELGWGGWWAWDPVENVALVCWLLLAASFHIGPRSGAAQVTHLALWSAVFAGAALTRTSLRTSVHAFADATAIGWGLWPLTAAAVAAAIVAAWRRGTGRRLTPPKLWRTLAPGALVASAVIVAVGTYRPLMPGGATAGWFYARTLYPMLVFALPAMGLLRPGVSRPSTRSFVFLAAGFTAGLTTAAMTGATELPQLVLAAGVGAGSASLLDPPWNGRTIAHAGVFVVVIGILGATASTTATRTVETGSTTSVAGHVVRLDSVQVVETEPVRVEAWFDVDGRATSSSIVQYPARGIRLTETGTVTTIWTDVQVVLRTADNSGTAVVMVNVQPLTSAVWIGSAIVGLGAVMSTRQRHRDRNHAAGNRSQQTV